MKYIAQGHHIDKDDEKGRIKEEMKIIKAMSFPRKSYESKLLKQHDSKWETPLELPAEKRISSLEELENRFFWLSSAEPERRERRACDLMEMSWEN